MTNDLLQPKQEVETVRVVVRCRPLNKTELQDQRRRIVEMDLQRGQVAVHNPKLDASEAPKYFYFDQTFDWNVAQQTIYDSTARGIVDSVMDGYNGTIFAYGQTGTGKTHTMEGYPTPELQGIIPNAFHHIFQTIEMSENRQCLVRASFLEIYNEEVRDLLAKNPKNKLEVKEHKDAGVYVKGLTTFVVKNATEIKNVLEVGKKNRSVGATLMNQDSSRSHSIFSITIETIDQGGGVDEGHIRVGKLNLVDLAGSERQSKTGATGERLKEATKINLSLSALGNVISALVDGKNGHIPYRDSKLTRLLQDSLGGNTKTVMVANMGPADWNYDETISTLRYADRAKRIKNKPKINEDPKDAMLREYQEEIMRLKQALEEEQKTDLDVVPDSEGVVERVVEKEMSLKQEDLERIRNEVEIQLRKEAEQEAGASLSEEKIHQIKQQAESRLAEEFKKATDEAAQYAKNVQEKKVELDQQQEIARKAKQDKALMRKRLKMMESKLLHGEQKGGLAEVMRQKEEKLKIQQQKLESQRKAEEEFVEKIAVMEEQNLAAEEKYASLQEEADAKSKKLKSLFKKYQDVSREMDDLYSEFQREKEDLVEQIRLLQSQMQLKTIVTEAFIPQEEVQKITRKAVWEEEKGVWMLQSLADNPTEASYMKRPVSAAGLRRPTSEYGKMANAMGDMNPRFKSDNILTLELDMPERTTFDYYGPDSDNLLQRQLNAAFAEDGEFMMIEPSTSHGKVILVNDI